MMIHVTFQDHAKAIEAATLLAKFFPRIILLIVHIIFLLQRLWFWGRSVGCWVVFLGSWCLADRACGLWCLAFRVLLGSGSLQKHRGLNLGI